MSVAVLLVATACASATRQSTMATNVEPAASPTVTPGPTVTRTPAPTAPIVTPTSGATATATATPTVLPPVTPTAAAPTDTLYVALGGTGDGSSPDAPLGSIAEAMQRLAPGMVLEIAAGRYVGDLEVLDPPAGTAAEPIRVRARGRVEIEGLVRFWRLFHWDISGLNVTWPSWGTADDHLVKLTGGTDWTFRDAEVWGARSYAAILVAGPAQRYVLTGLHVHDTVPSNDVNQDHLIYVNSTSGPGLITRNLLVGSPNGRAVKVGGPTSASVVRDVIISYNTMIDNTGPSNVQVSGGVFDVAIHNNVMVRPGDGRNAVTSFDFWGEGVRVFDNVVWQAAGVADPGIIDGGGNVLVDPQLDAAGRATNPTARAAGHLAGS